MLTSSTRTRNTRSSSIVDTRRSPATRSSASATIDRSVTVGAAANWNRGDQAPPPPRRPSRPGRPVTPEPCSGTIDTGATTSSPPFGPGRSSARRVASRSAPAPRGAPQWMIVGTPVSTSTTTSTGTSPARLDRTMRSCIRHRQYGDGVATVSFRQATRIYPGQERPAVDDLDLEIDDGEFLVLVGPSGGGKSTTLRILGGLGPTHRGTNLNG